MEVKFNKNNENPFYGLQHCLTLYQSSNKELTEHMLIQAWNEVRNDLMKKQMFFSLLFSIGDITARQHNIFGKDKIDSGGNAHRANFRLIMQWLRDNHYEQFQKFMWAGLFNQYTSFDNLLANRVVTVKKKTTITDVINMIGVNDNQLQGLADFLASIIKGNNPFDKMLVAKFLTRPKLSIRQKHKKLQDETKNIMRLREKLLKMVSQSCSFVYYPKPTHIEFTGYYQWRKDYNKDLESVLFSSKKILEFDEQQFLAWLDKLPSSARYRVRCRLLNDKNEVKKQKFEKTADTEAYEMCKWGNLPQWFLKWESFKTSKQTEVRQLENEIKERGITITDANNELVQKLNSVKKEAKVTVGAVNFTSMFAEIVKGTVDELKVQPFLDKIKLPYNTLTFLDDSGSMSSMANKERTFTAFDFANFMATICLMKNPDDNARDLLGYYSQTCRMFTHIDKMATARNSIVTAATRVANEPFIKPELHFLENLQRIRAFSTAVRTGNGTNLASIPMYLERWVNGDNEKIEQLQQFPVWTIISDGNWNNMSSPEASINDFMMQCQRAFGFKPYIIAIDVAHNTSADIKKFQGIENFMYIPPNPAQIEQLLTNFKDMDIMDVYTPLQSLYRSNRYRLVQNAVIDDLAN